MIFFEHYIRYISQLQIFVLYFFQLMAKLFSLQLMATHISTPLAAQNQTPPSDKKL